MSRVSSPAASLALILALLVAIAGCILPWTEHITAGFTMNAFDLAEWASLHPAVRSSSPPLLASFLLRAPQAAAAIALALAAGAWHDPRWRVVGWGAALLIMLRFVPPAEFFQSARSDPNYRQMALLTMLGGLGVAGAAWRRRWQRARFVVIGLLVAASVVAGWAGLLRTVTLLDHFEIAATIGPGPVVFSAAALVAGAIAGGQARARPFSNKKGD